MNQCIGTILILFQNQSQGLIKQSLCNNQSQRQLLPEGQAKSLIQFQTKLFIKFSNKQQRILKLIFVVELSIYDQVELASDHPLNNKTISFSMFSVHLIHESMLFWSARRLSIKSKLVHNIPTNETIFIFFTIRQIMK